MIAGFRNLESTCSADGKTKTVSVAAKEDSSGGTETLKFQILGQTQTVQETFAAKEEKRVTVTHTATGKGLVTVTALGSTQTGERILDVDKVPGDTGTAP